MGSNYCSAKSFHRKSHGVILSFTLRIAFLSINRPHQLVGEMFRRSSVGVATSRAGHHQRRSHRVLSSRVHFLDKGRSHPLGSCLSAPKICSLKPLPLEAQFHSDRARSEKSVLSFIASFLIGELLFGKLSETVVVQGNAPHDRPGFLVGHLIGNRASFLCTKAPMLRIPETNFLHGITSHQLMGEIFRRSSYTAAVSSIASTELPRPECIFWTRAAATLGTCSSAPKICSLKPPAQRHSLALIPASVLPREIASAHRIADGRGRP